MESYFDKQNQSNHIIDQEIWKDRKYVSYL